MTLTMIMAMNNGVLRPRDHVGSRALFDGLVRDGAIVRVLPGTFVDATLLTQRSTRFAAALAATTGSVLWGEDAAAALTGALDDRPFAANDQVMLAHPQGRRPLPGVLWVRRRVPDDRRVRVRGLRCPSAAYLAVEASARDDGALIERLLRERLMTPSDLVDVLGCFAATPGQRVRRRVVRASLDNPWSGGERHLQQLLRRNRIGGWVANHELVVDGQCYYPDLYFDSHRLVVEFDGFQVHSRPEVFETDRARQNVLVLADYRVLRFTWKQLKNDPDGILRQLRGLLAREMTTDLHPGRA